MSKTAHIIDILLRSFFLFIVFWLLFSYVFRGFFAVFFTSVFLTVIINVIFEFIWGRKYWRKSASNEQKPKRDIKKALRGFLRRAFSRDKTKGFVWVGIVLLLSSFVVQLNIYYIVFACVVFIFAAVTRFLPPQPILPAETTR